MTVIRHLCITSLALITALSLASCKPSTAPAPKSTEKTVSTSPPVKRWARFKVEIVLDVHRYKEVPTTAPAGTTYEITHQYPTQIVYSTTLLVPEGPDPAVGWEDPQGRKFVLWFRGMSLEPNAVAAAAWGCNTNLTTQPILLANIAVRAHSETCAPGPRFNTGKTVSTSLGVLQMPDGGNPGKPGVEEGLRLNMTLLGVQDLEDMLKGDTPPIKLSDAFQDQIKQDSASATNP